MSKLYSRAYQAERDAAEVERQLSRVEAEQDELGMWLGQYESAVDEMVGKISDGGELAGPDQERERVYSAAGKLSATLEGFNNDLGEVITEINAVSGKLNRGGKGDDPVCAFVS